MQILTYLVKWQTKKGIIFIVGTVLNPPHLLIQSLSHMNQSLIYVPESEMKLRPGGVK